MKIPEYVHKLAAQGGRGVAEQVTRLIENAVTNARHLAEIRRLTIREALTIMDKQDDFLIHVPDADIERIVSAELAELAYEAAMSDEEWLEHIANESL